MTLIGYFIDGPSTCKGDSGGPLSKRWLTMDKRNVHVQLGVVSADVSLQCMQNDFPSIFVRLEDVKIMTFIKGIIGMCHK